jgi:S-adenosylmethionine decarboxylase
MIDTNVYQENIFHTKMILKDFDLNNYLFGMEKEDLSVREVQRIKKLLRWEMLEIFYGRNMNKLPKFMD